MGEIESCMNLKVWEAKRFKPNKKFLNLQLWVSDVKEIYHAGIKKEMYLAIS